MNPAIVCNPSAGAVLRRVEGSAAKSHTADTGRKRPGLDWGSGILTHLHNS